MMTDELEGTGTMEHLPVAVYGTLRHGHGNWYSCLKGHYTQHRRGLAKGYVLYCQGIPYAVPMEGGATVVDVFTVRATEYEYVMRRLDQLEGYSGPGHNNHYDRVKVEITIPLEDGLSPAQMAEAENYYTTPCWMYVLGENSGSGLTIHDLLVDSDGISDYETYSWSSKNWTRQDRRASGLDRLTLADLEAMTDEQFREWYDSLSQADQAGLYDRLDELENEGDGWAWDNDVIEGNDRDFGTADGKKKTGAVPGTLLDTHHGWEDSDWGWTGKKSSGRYYYRYGGKKARKEGVKYYNVFAFGSNLDELQMAQRGVVWIERTAAFLDDYALVFNKQAGWGERAYANIAHCPGSVVEGALYTVDEASVEELDRCEGVGSHYLRCVIDVVRTHDGKTIPAIVYVAHPMQVREGLKPSEWYMEHILAGADLLSPEYVAWLKGIEVVNPAPIKTVTPKATMTDDEKAAACSTALVVATATAIANAAREANSSPPEDTGGPRSMEEWAEICGLGGAGEETEDNRPIHAIPLSEEVAL